MMQNPRMPRSKSSPATAEVIRATTAVGEHYYAAASAVGLSVQEARLLYILSLNPSNMLGLTSALSVPKSTMSGLITRMESAGLVVRSPDPRDRRNLLATPTPLGTDVATAFARDLAARVSAVLSVLDSEERVELGGILSEVLLAIEE
jgi:MarR family transcriptional regulator, lower aerobic nicotinate degradation pathway regulator